MPKQNKPDLEAFKKAALSTMTPEAKARYDEARGRRGKELELWQSWHQGGRKQEHLAPLLKSIHPLIRSETTKRLAGLGGSIPRAALENALQNAAVKAVHSYDPSKGKLSTHIGNSFMSITDFVAANRNARYMPREDFEKKQTFDGAMQELDAELGRPPTVLEIKQKLPQWNEKQIRKMQRGFGAEVYTDMGTDFEEVSTMTPRDAFHLVKSQMSDVEKRFGDLHFPESGRRPNIKTIAKSLGVNEHKAYRIKAQVETRVGKILKGE
jgi:DNA-directed RNA polymerase specialized sigma subunit